MSDEDVEKKVPATVFVEQMAQQRGGKEKEAEQVAIVEVHECSFDGVTAVPSIRCKTCLCFLIDANIIS
jgi:hypothetical protein